MPLDTFEGDDGAVVVSCQVEGAGASGSSMQPPADGASRAGASRSSLLRPPADDGDSGRERQARGPPPRRAGRRGPGENVDDTYSSLLHADLQTARLQHDMMELKRRALVTKVELHEKELQLREKELEVKEDQLQLVRQQRRIADIDEETARLNQAKARLELQLVRDNL